MKRPSLGRDHLFIHAFMESAWDTNKGGPVLQEGSGSGYNTVYSRAASWLHTGGGCRIGTSVYCAQVSFKSIFSLE